MWCTKGDTKRDTKRDTLIRSRVVQIEVGEGRVEYNFTLFDTATLWNETEEYIYKPAVVEEEEFVIPVSSDSLLVRYLLVRYYLIHHVYK